MRISITIYFSVVRLISKVLIESLNLLVNILYYYPILSLARRPIFSKSNSSIVYYINIMPRSIVLRFAFTIVVSFTLAILRSLSIKRIIFQK